MPTLSARGTGATTVATTWSNPANVYDTNTATSATWVNAARSIVGSIEVTGFNFSTIPAGATVNSVTVNFIHSESSTTIIASLALEPFSNGVSADTAQAPARNTALTTTSHVFTGITLAELQTAFSVKATATRSNSTTSTTWTIADIEVVVDYTNVVAPPSGTIKRGTTANTDYGVTASSTTTTSSTGPLLSGLANGDFLVAMVAVASQTDTITGPAGWTAVAGGNVTVPTAAAGKQIQLFYHLVTNAASETGPTFSWTTSAKSAIHVIKYTGVDTTTPIDVVGLEYDSGGASVSTFAAPAITTVTAGAVVIACAVLDADTAATLTMPSGYSAIQQSSGVRSGLADLTFATASSTGTVTWTESGTLVPAGAILIALRPQASGPQNSSGGSNAGLNVTTSQSGSPKELLSGGSTAGLNVTTAQAGVAKEIRSGGSTAGLNVTTSQAGTGKDTPSGGSVAGVNTTTSQSGTGTEAGTGGSNAGLSITTSQAGIAKEIRSGGSTAGANVTTSQAGTPKELLSGGSTAGLNVTTAQAGTARDTPSSGSSAGLNVTTSQVGTAKEIRSGGSVAGVDVTVTGGGTSVTPGAFSGGSSAGLSITTTQSGTAKELVSSGSVAGVVTTTSQAGIATERVSAGSTAGVVTTTSQTGTARELVSSGSTAGASITTTQSGTARELVSAGSVAGVNVTASGGGTGSFVEAHSGGSTAYLFDKVDKNAVILYRNKAAIRVGPGVYR